MKSKEEFKTQRKQFFIAGPARLIRLALAVALLSTLNPARLQAQTLDTASVRGKVVDQTGAVISDAAVSLINKSTGLHKETQTDANGYYTIAGLPLTGSYKLVLGKTGFASKEQDNIELRAGEAATFNATLNPAGVNSAITILGTTEGIKPDSPELSTRFDLEKIDNTPVFGRKITNLVLLNSAVKPARGTGDLFLNNQLFEVNGSGRRQTSFSIDGSTGDDAWGRQTLFTNIPLSALQEFTVLTNSFSAEYGRTTGSVVNIITKTGTNDYHGDFLGLWRPAGIQARSPLATKRTADKLSQFSSVFSGPIVKDQTHFLFGFEYNHQDRDAVITSPLNPSIYTGKYRQALLFTRFDHQINSNHTLNGRINFDRFYDANPADAVSGNALVSAARVFRRRTYAAQLSDTASFSPNVINEARFQFQLGSPITKFDPVNSSTQFVRPGVATEGESRSASLLNHQYEFADTLSLVRGKQYFKFGGNAIYSRSGGYGQEFGSGFVLGQFTFKTSVPVSTPTADLKLSDVQNFTQSFGNASYRVNEWLWSLFAQDNINLRSNFTLNLGLRYERQTFTDDKNNLSPRLGFAYNFRGDKQTVLRGGYGIYYSEIRANAGAGYALNGPEGVFTYSVAPGGFGFPTSLSALQAFPPGATLPARDITIRPGRRDTYNRFFDVSKLRNYQDALLNPYTQQATLGIERELGGRWFVSADYVYQHTIRIDRNIDLNAPAPFTRTAPGQTRPAAVANATRPILPVVNGYRRILGTVNEGASLYNALQLNLNKRFGSHFSMLASYTYSHAINTIEADAPGGDPNDGNQLGAFERGDSLINLSHRAVISGWWNLPYHFVFGGVTALNSGRPFNLTTGTDNNGDGANSDRPVIGNRVIGRNLGRGTPTYDVSTFVEREFLFGEHIKLGLRAEAFNLFNHPNIVGRSGVYGNAADGKPLATFGQALGGIANVDPGREFQFQARFRF